MNKPLFIPIFFALLVLSSGLLHAQQAHPIVAYFSGARVKNSIQLNWVILGGNTCNGTLIQRSTDGFSFETIGEIAGICGSPDVDVPYVFTDENPLPNQPNYYRLELGSQGYTTPLIIEFFPLNENGYSLILDRTNDKAQIFFNNPDQLTTSFALYTLEGKIISTGETSGANILFGLENLPVQLFVLTVSNTTGGFSVKIPNF